MIKEKTKIFLIIVLIIQLISPFTFLIYQNRVNKRLEDDTIFIKLNIDSISVGYENEFYINFSEHYLDEYEYHPYIIFEPSINNEYSEFKYSEFEPDTKFYLENYEFQELMYYNIKDPYGIYEKHLSLNLYNKYNELDNVARGYYDGPLTEAYALVGIYNNQFKINEIYINGHTLEEHIRLYENNEIDIMRYHNYSWGVEYTEEDYLKIIPESKRNLYYLVLEKELFSEPA